MTSAEDRSSLLHRTLKGDRVALARLLSRAERGGAGFASIHAELFDRVGGALRLGFTGPPGAGKSTLVEAYALERRKAADRIAVVAVDPTSPFTGGALLGDRVRMERIAMDPGCFVRSMASRGAFGGLARSSDDVADVLDAAGFDRILIETVGVGQSEVDVARAADLTLVILVPGTGDAVQAMKAGLMEIADIIVVNKADRPGVDRLSAELEEVLAMRLSDSPPPPVIRTVATNGEGVEQLDQEIETLRATLLDSGQLAERRQRRIGDKVRRIVEESLRRDLFDGKGLERRVDEVMAELKGQSPYEVARVLLDEAGLTGDRAKLEQMR